MKAINPLNTKLNPICHLLALLGAHYIFHVSGLRVNVLCKAAGTLRLNFITLVQVSLAQLMSLCHSNINCILGTGVNNTGTTNSS